MTWFFRQIHFHRDLFSLAQLPERSVRWLRNQAWQSAPARRDFARIRAVLGHVTGADFVVQIGVQDFIADALDDLRLRSPGNSTSTRRFRLRGIKSALPR